MADIYQTFAIGNFAVAHYRLWRGEILTKAELAQIIRANPGVALPPAIADHMAQRLEGEVEDPKPADPWASLRDLLVLIHYERDLAWLQARRRRFGLSPWPSVEWNRKPAHERAARMVARSLGLHCDWRHTLNLVSRQRRPQQR